MPWTPSDAQRHDKAADTPKLQREWSHIANEVLKKTGDEGNRDRDEHG